MARSGRPNATGNDEKLKQPDDTITADRIYHVAKHYERFLVSHVSTSSLVELVDCKRSSHSDQNADRPLRRRIVASEEIFELCNTYINFLSKIIRRNVLETKGQDTSAIQSYREGSRPTPL